MIVEDKIVIESINETFDNSCSNDGHQVEKFEKL